MSQNLKKYLKKLILEYTGTGDMSSTGLTSDDGNNATSQRSRFHDPRGVDEMEFYLQQNKGDGGDGGHYKNYSARADFNRVPRVRFEELENYIKQVLEELEEEAYGHATLTTQGQSISGAPGVWQEDEKELQEQSVEDLQRRIQTNNDENIELQLDIQRIGLEDQAAQSQAQASQQTKQIDQLEIQMADLNSKKSQIIGFIKQAAAELNQNFPEDVIDYTPEDIERKDELTQEVGSWRQQLADIKQQLKDLAKQKGDQTSAASKAQSASQRALSMARKNFNQQAKQMRKQIGKPVAEELIKKYFKDTNADLMERMDSYKREVLFESATSKFFSLFDKGKTDEEILRLYAEQGVVVPEQFITKLRKKHEGLKHDKLDLEEFERETKNFKKIPLVDEDEIEVKELSSRLFKEEKIKKRYPMPPEIKEVLQNTLKMNPLMRFVKNLKAVNSIPPSYRIFLLNGKHFDIIYETYSLKIKIGIDEYWMGETADVNYAIKHINRLMTEPVLKSPEEDIDDLLGDLPKPSGPKPSGPKPTLPSPTPTPSPPPTTPED